MGTVAAVALMLGLAACTGDGRTATGGREDDSEGARTQPQGPASSPQEPPLLEQKWSFPATGEVTDQLRVGDDLVIAQQRSLTVAALDDGRVAHRIRLPRGQRLCEVSETSTDGLVAIAFGSAARARTAQNDAELCQRVGVVDTRTGKLRWHRSVPGYSDSDAEVAIGDRVVTTKGDCGEVRRFDARSGEDLSVVIPEDDGCDNTAGLTGQWVVGVVGTDTSAGAGHLEMYDADTGRRLWRRPVWAEGAELESVVTAEPLVLDIRGNGQRLMHRYDARTGERGVLVGRPLGSSGPSGDFIVLSHQDDRLVGVPSSSDDATTYAMDTVSGEQTAAFIPSPPWGLVAARGGLLSFADVLDTSGRTPAGSTHLVNLIDPLEPDRPLTLGTLDLPSIEQAATYGDLLVVADERVSAYRLPAEGAYRPDLLRANSLETVAGKDSVPHPFAPEDHPDMCSHVPVTTLAPLRLRTDLPPPYDCTWRSADGSAYLTVSSQFAVDANAPLSLGGSSGGDAVPGLGEEAWIDSRSSPSSLEMSLFVRYRNFVATFDYSFDGPGSPPGPGTPSAAEAEHALTQAARGMIAPLRQPHPDQPGDTQ